MDEKKGDAMQMSLTSAHWDEQKQIERDRTKDTLNPARGIAIGCAIGASLWAGLAATFLV